MHRTTVTELELMLSTVEAPRAVYSSLYRLCNLHLSHLQPQPLLPATLRLPVTVVIGLSWQNKELLYGAQLYLIKN